MRCHLIHCHPVPNSFNAAVCRTVQDALGGAGHAIDRLDLYAEGFEPAMSCAERSAHFDEARNRAPVAPYVERLKRAEALIFVYPTWWYGMPAMLKGWLDRVWLPGVAFTMPEGDRPIGPLMRHVTRLAVVTTYGAPWWYIQYCSDPGVRTISRGLKALCAKGCRFDKLAHYRMDQSTPATRAAFLADVARHFARY